MSQYDAVVRKMKKEVTICRRLGDFFDLVSYCAVKILGVMRELTKKTSVNHDFKLWAKTSSRIEYRVEINGSSLT